MALLGPSCCGKLNAQCSGMSHLPYVSFSQTARTPPKTQIASHDIMLHYIALIALQRLEFISKQYWITYALHYRSSWGIVFEMIRDEWQWGFGGFAFWTSQRSQICWTAQERNSLRRKGSCSMFGLCHNKVWPLYCSEQFVTIRFVAHSLLSLGAAKNHSP